MVWRPTTARRAAHAIYRPDFDSIHLLRMRKSSLLKIRASHPQLAHDLARLNWCHAARVIDNLQWREERSVLARTRRRLALLALCFGRPISEGVLIDLRLTQQQLAELVDSSRQRTNFSLNTPERSGEIRQLDRQILLLRPAGKHAKAEPDPLRWEALFSRP